MFEVVYLTIRYSSLSDLPISKGVERQNATQRDFDIILHVVFQSVLATFNQIPLLMNVFFILAQSPAHRICAVETDFYMWL